MGKKEGRSSASISPVSRPEPFTHTSHDPAYRIHSSLPFPRRSSLNLPYSYTSPFSLLRIPPTEKRSYQFGIMELTNFVMLLMIAAIINAAPMVDIQRTDEVGGGGSPPTPSNSSNTTGDGASGDADPVGGPGPTGTQPANDPQGTAVPACVPTDPGNVCEVGLDSGSANRSMIVC